MKRDLYEEILLGNGIFTLSGDKLDFPENVSFEEIQDIFPLYLDSACVIAFLLIPAFNPFDDQAVEWLGATKSYIDLLARGFLSKSNMYPSLDLDLFWESMNRLVDDGYVETETGKIHEELQDAEVFAPTPKLIDKINCSLPR